VRDWQLNRDEEYDYAKEAGIPVSTSKKSPYSVDANLWGRSSECGVIEFPEKEVPEEVLQWITPPEKAPDAPEFVTLNFEGGIPVSMTMNSEKDGKRTKKIAGTTELILELNEIAGKNGVGIIEQMEDRVIGLKSHEFYECPAATVVLKAHKDLEKMVLTKEEMKFKPIVDKLFSEMVYEGLWHSPLVKALCAFVDVTQEKVSGWVKVKLYKGSCQVVARSSPNALYNLNLATYEKTSKFNQLDSIGFIKLFGLNTVLSNQLGKAKKGKEGMSLDD
jgi:argininosuccinate synthase